MFLLVVKSLVKRHNKLKELSNCSCSKSRSHLKYLSKLLLKKYISKFCSLKKLISKNCFLKNTFQKLLPEKIDFKKLLPQNIYFKKYIVKIASSKTAFQKLFP